MYDEHLQALGPVHSDIRADLDVHGKHVTKIFAVSGVGVPTSAKLLANGALNLDCRKVLF
eukprot:CAMPEP_0113724652 /NCGR_PEP_ID=MMETSP0038_2-20120614/39223_1 /TAXON_ID=2898 /ORGANISM="Cryptomonas paramecium" /LENGTH=59 /DNA_ID=CAMNT_0000654627 /DNA_START=51 /DNA_END=228 /DNA_ORIENTATION=+ /assembly_acc=CAM_ASM_000170